MKQSECCNALRGIRKVVVVVAVVVAVAVVVVVAVAVVVAVVVAVNAGAAAWWEHARRDNRRGEDDHATAGAIPARTTWKRRV